MNNVLIAGARGFLGSVLAKKCLERNIRLSVLVKAGTELSFASSCAQVYTDVNALPDEFDVVFNAAAYIPYGKYGAATPGLFTSNTLLNYQLLERIPNAKIVYASSVAVYGNAVGIISETSDVSAPTMYGVSKLAGEMVGACFNKFSVVRFSSIYGPGMYSNTFIPAIIRSAKTNRMISLLGNGSRLQNYIHVRDAAGFLFAAAESGNNRVYLGVAEESCSNQKIAEIIQSNLPSTGIEYKGDDTSPSFVYDNAITRNELNYQCKIGIESGIRELIEYE